jgi:branched-chain amino acid transport system ATP-binding protein
MLLQLADVRASYSGFTALHEIDLAVDRGQGVGVVGGNGAGKSTLANVILGLKSIDEGTITFDGHKASRSCHRRVRKGIGYVPERRQLFGEMSVRDNLLVPLRTSRRRGAERIDELVELFPWMGDRLDDRADVLSGGQQTAVALARALAHRPQLLVVEEPSKSLSPNAVGVIREHLLTVRQTGLAMIVFEQQIYRLHDLVDEVNILSRGRIEATGSPDDPTLEHALSTSIIGAAAPG